MAALLADDCILLQGVQLGESAHVSDHRPAKFRNFPNLPNSNKVLSVQIFIFVSELAKINPET